MNSLRARTWLLNIAAPPELIMKYKVWSGTPAAPSSVPSGDEHDISLLEHAFCLVDHDGEDE